MLLFKVTPPPPHTLPTETLTNVMHYKILNSYMRANNSCSKIYATCKERCTIYVIMFDLNTCTSWLQPKGEKVN